MRRVPLVAAEQLISPIAADHGLDSVGAGHLRAAKRRHDGRVTEGLAVDLREAGNDANDVARFDVVLLVTRAEVARRDSRVLDLVEPALIEAD